MGWKKKERNKQTEELKEDKQRKKEFLKWEKRNKNVNR